MTQGVNSCVYAIHHTECAHHQPKVAYRILLHRFAEPPATRYLKHSLTFLSLALACTLSTNENKFSSVNVSRREPRFRFPCRGGPREPQSSVFALRTPWLAPPVLLGAYYEIGGRQAPALRVNQRSALYIINATR